MFTRKAVVVIYIDGFLRAWRRLPGLALEADQVGGRVVDRYVDVRGGVVRTVPVRGVAAHGEAVPRLRERDADPGVLVVAAGKEDGERAAPVEAHPAPGVLAGTVDA